MSDDLISRQAAIDAMAELQGRASTKAELKGISKAWKRIKELQPIQPDIVRCKDCKHWIPYDWMFSEAWQSKNIADYPEDEIDCEWSEMSMKANDFCSRAEKREVTT